MATLNFTFDTGTVTTQEVLNAFASAYGYQTDIPDPQNPGATIPNPETKAQFARRQVRQYIIEIIRSQRRGAATATALAGVVDPAFTD